MDLMEYKLTGYGFGQYNINVKKIEERSNETSFGSSPNPFGKGVWKMWRFRTESVFQFERVTLNILLIFTIITKTNSSAESDFMKYAP